MGGRLLNYVLSETTKSAKTIGTTLLLIDDKISLQQDILHVVAVQRLIVSSADYVRSVGNIDAVLDFAGRRSEVLANTLWGTHFEAISQDYPVQFQVTP